MIANVEIVLRVLQAVPLVHASDLWLMLGMVPALIYGRDLDLLVWRTPGLVDVK